MGEPKEIPSSDASEIPKNVKLVRVGKCIRCGVCCSQVVFNLPYSPRLDDYLNWVVAHRGLRVQMNEASGEADIVVPAKCRFLRVRRGKSRCTAYDKRPIICRNFPSSPLSAMRCKGFSFEPETADDPAPSP